MTKKQLKKKKIYNLGIDDLEKLSSMSKYNGFNLSRQLEHIIKNNSVFFQKQNQEEDKNDKNCNAIKRV